MVNWDVIVIGAGPGGSATAAVLAQSGVRVLVLEKDAFPRFHIGESLLPASALTESVLGIQPDPKAFLHKQGAQFVCEGTGRTTTFDFADALPGPPRHAYHVERSAFDTQLRDRAREFGAEVRHGVRVTAVDVHDDSVAVRCGPGLERARFVVDATGQDRFMAMKLRSVVPYRHFGKAASFVHFEGISDETIEEFAPANDIRILIVEDGWAWVIPLTRRRLSVGLVTRKRGGLRAESVLDYARESQLIRRWTAGAVSTAPRLIGNFSCRNAQSYGPRFACVGDAACFIDPVFSSGVSLALTSGIFLARRLAEALEAGAEGEPDLAAPVSVQMQPAYDTFCALVYRFYNTRFVDNLLFGAPEQSDLRSSVVSVLAGDVLRDGNLFRDMLLRSRRQPWRGDDGAPRSLQH